MKKAFGVVFSKYFWLGVLWLLLAMLIEERVKPEDFIVRTLIELIATISISIVVASIFTYTLGTTVRKGVSTL